MPPLATETADASNANGGVSNEVANGADGSVVPAAAAAAAAAATSSASAVEGASPSVSPAKDG